jgi:hypothetical protein
MSLDNLKETARGHFNSVVSAFDNAADLAVTKSLSLSAPFARAITDTAISLGKGGGLCMAAGAAGGLLFGDIKTGLIAGGIAGTIIGLPMGMMMGVDGQVEGTSLGHRLEAFMDSKHDDYVDANNLRGKVPYQTLRI